MIITKMHLPRRTVLRGLGATLALPLLDCMVPALTAVSKTAAAPVRRFGVFYPPNGMSMPYWSPTAEGPLTELPPTLRSLADFKNEVLLCGGLDNEPAKRVAFRIESLLCVPGLEGILDVPQSRLGKLREVAEDHGLQRGVVDPGETFLRVCLLVVAIGVEAIRLKPAGGVQNEDLEKRLTEPEPGRAMSFS